MNWEECKKPGVYCFNNNGVPFYVGASKNIRNRIKQHLRYIQRVKEPQAGEYFYNTLRLCVLTCDIKVLEITDTVEQAFEKEKEYILKIGRKDLSEGTLTNRTDGGDATLGWNPSDQTRAIWSNQRKGTGNFSFGSHYSLMSETQKKNRNTKLSNSLKSSISKKTEDDKKRGSKKGPDEKFYSLEEYTEKFGRKFLSNNEFKVKTHAGFKEFAGVARMGVKPIRTIVLEDGSRISGSTKHTLITNCRGGKKYMESFKVGDMLTTLNGDLKIVAIETGTRDITYDLIEVEDTHSYIINNSVISSNCRFVSADDTLIDSGKLLSLNAYVRKPIYVDRFKTIWYDEIKPNTVYGVMLDPSEGVGGDNACIQVFALPDMTQVAEWVANEVDMIDQAKQLVRILKRIDDEQQSLENHIGESLLYYSVECNGVGQGVLNVILYEGEDVIPGMLIDSDGNKSRGIRTTAPSKRDYAVKLKAYIERNIFIPYSRGLVSELKNFVKRGKGYEAKPGEKDDRVMACVLMCHLLDELKYYEEDIEDALQFSIMNVHDEEYEEDYEIQPNPIIF